MEDQGLPHDDAATQNGQFFQDEQFGAFGAFLPQHQDPNHPFAQSWLDPYQNFRGPSAVQQQSVWQDNSLQRSSASPLPPVDGRSNSYGPPFPNESAPFIHPSYATQFDRPFSPSNFTSPASFGQAQVATGQDTSFAENTEFTDQHDYGGTISPHALQSHQYGYGQPSSNTQSVSINHDPSAIASSAFPRPSSDAAGAQLSSSMENPVRYSAFDAAASYPMSPSGITASTPLDTANPKLLNYSTQTPNQSSNLSFPPAGTSLAQPSFQTTDDGKFLTYDMDQLTKSTASDALGRFAAVGRNAIDLNTTKTTLPRYKPRMSKNQIRMEMLGSALRENQEPAGHIRQQINKRLKLDRTGSSLARSSVVSLSPRPSGEPKEDESSEDEPEDDSDYTSEEEEDLPETRPQGVHEGLRWDVGTVLRLPSYRRASPNEIRKHMTDFWENTMKAIRNDWRAATISLKKAEEAKDDAKVSTLKKKVAEKQSMIETSIRAARELGDKEIVGPLGEHSLFMVFLANVLLNRMNHNDAGGSLCIAILQLLVRCDTLTEKNVADFGLGKTLNRFVAGKKGNEETKRLARQVLENAAAESKRKGTASSTAENNVSITKSNNKSNGAVFSSGTQEPAAGIKRLRDEDTKSDQPKKKAVTTAVAPPSTGGASAKSLVPSVKRPISSSTATKPPSIPAISASGAKPKTAHAQPRPSNFFSSLQSASKKPGTSNAATAATQKGQSKGGAIPSTEKKAAAPTAAMGAPKPTFSFAQTMANLTRAKEPEPVSKPVERGPPENEEDRRKRLRKEERRKMRVTFKPDDSLVEVRLFTHDPAEEVGHEESMMRDVSDVGGEGRIFKQHKDMDMMDEEDDEGNANDSLKQFQLPSFVDLGVIENDERTRNYVTRGGLKQVESSESKVQEQREMNTLMAIYTHASDIPASPREPSDPVSGQQSELISFGEPPEIPQNRAAQIQAQLHSRPSQPSATGPATDISALLRVLNGGHPQPQANQRQAPLTELEKVFAMHSGGAQQAPQFQQPVTQQAPGINLQAILSAIPSQNQGQSNMQSTPQVPQLQSILSQLGQHGAVYGQQQQSQPVAQPDDDDEDDYDPEKLDLSEPSGAYGNSEQGPHGSNNGGGFHNNEPANRDIKYTYPCKFIEPFQKGETPTFIEHAKAGLRTLSEDAGNALLIFSGGPTKASLTPLSEAQSYLALCRSNNYFGYPVHDGSDDVSTEDLATDSFQNVLFSILRFRTLVGHYPSRITLVSHAFKRERFVALHARALRWPLQALDYVGIDPPPEITPRAVLVAGERERGVGLWARDLYGARSQLREKRVQRGWRQELLPEVEETSVMGLVRWEGGESGLELYPYRLPWSESEPVNEC
ncbi:MAG: hypothetical protein M1819_003558 [Sarea resinae]|nr:MAG: hypothetical protein M1819_003558 [Sarea resinae]